MEEALSRLKNPGGNRTAEWLVGPASKQRYMDAKTLVDKMKAGMEEAERVRLANDLIDILQNHTRPGEGEIRHFLLLALGRSWQKGPKQPEMNSEAARASREKVLAILSSYAADPEIATRKAALLATVYLAGHPEVRAVIALLVEKVSDPREDLDVRMAAATALGPVATPQDRNDALFPVFPAAPSSGLTMTCSRKYPPPPASAGSRSSVCTCRRLAIAPV